MLLPYFFAKILLVKIISDTDTTIDKCLKKIKIIIPFYMENIVIININSKVKDKKHSS